MVHKKNMVKELPWILATITLRMRGQGLCKLAVSYGRLKRQPQLCRAMFNEHVNRLWYLPMSLWINYNNIIKIANHVNSENYI